MEPESKYTMVERFVSEDLTGKDLDDFQNLLLSDPSLSKDIELSMEIEEALQENDIINLRKKLQMISVEEGYSEPKEVYQKLDTYFGLADEIDKAVNLDVDDSELSGLGNFLQKLHIYNHAKASKETIHEMYKPEEIISDNETEFLSAEDEQIFDEIHQAVKEKDIINLRANLNSIANSISVHDHSFSDIEGYISGDLDEDLSLIIAEEALVNDDLAEEINLFRDIDSAIGEEDVMSLRASMKQIMGTETSHTRSFEEIDEYLDGALHEDAVASFEEELLMNPGLAAELKLNGEINEAIGEREIMSLRRKLQSISAAEKESGKEKRGLAMPKRKQIVWYAAASIVLLLGITGILKNRSYTDQQIYTEFYQPYSGIANTSRSLSTDGDNLMGEAIASINQQDYDSALKLLDGILSEDENNYTGNFYSGLSYQGKGEYNNAIQSFAKVISHGDNLFIEQSEWYLGLCYLNNEEREKAVRQFRKIAASNGYYQASSEKILKRLK